MPFDPVGSIGNGLDLQLIGKAIGKTDSSEESKPVAGFGDMLTQKLDDLNKSQADSKAAVREIATDNVDDIAQNLLRMEQATIQMQYATQVRNKVIESYQEITRMQI